MLILILVDVKYLKNFVFSFEKDSNGQKYSSDSHYPTKKFPQQYFPFPPLGEFTTPQPLTLFGKPWVLVWSFIVGNN